MSRKAVAKAKSNLPAVSMYEDDAGGGFEETSAADYAIPFLVALQKLSPVCDEDNAKHVDGAKPGQLFNTVTEQRFPAKHEDGEFVNVIPCAYQRQFVEWKLRENGGGFVGVHSVAEGEALLSASQKDDKNRDILPNGNQLADTRQHYILAFNPEVNDWEPVILGMTSTQVKVSRKWMTVMKNLKMDGANGRFTPPMYSHIYQLSTILESNDQGSWRSFVIGNPMPIEDDMADVYHKAKDFKDMVMGGEVRAAYESTVESDDAEVM